jgi:Fur family ferric uptake transcriptional regulator
MRQLVVKALMEHNKAISLPELEQKFEKADKATLYRTLKTFQENKLIHTIDDGSGSVKYALCEDSCTCQPNELHIHFLCQKCGQTYCFKDMPVPIPLLPGGFNFENANFVIKGTCSKCNL